MTPEQKEECPGSAVEPEAAKGMLCLYVQLQEKNATAVKIAGGAQVSGAAFVFPAELESATGTKFPTEIVGTWAVTSE